MIKDTKNTHKAQYQSTKYIPPDEKLVEWFEERLRLEDEKKSKEKAGGKSTTRLYKEMKSSSARKSNILDLIVFPSMANLVYFFGRIHENPQLNKLFEKDITELLDPTFVEEDIHNFETEHDTSADVFRSNAFARLVLTALKIPDEKIYFNGSGPITDFRIALLYQLQSIVRDLVQDVVIRDYGPTGTIAVKVREDFSDALKWLTFIANAAVREERGKHHSREVIIYPTKGLDTAED